jgi:hypothetical protein
VPQLLKSCLVVSPSHSLHRRRFAARVTRTKMHQERVKLHECQDNDKTTSATLGAQSWAHEVARATTERKDVYIRPLPDRNDVSPWSRQETTNNARNHTTVGLKVRHTKDSEEHEDRCCTRISMQVIRQKRPHAPPQPGTGDNQVRRSHGTRASSSRRRFATKQVCQKRYETGPVKVTPVLRASCA